MHSVSNDGLDVSVHVCLGVPDDAGIHCSSDVLYDEPSTYPSQHPPLGCTLHVYIVGSVSDREHGGGSAAQKLVATDGVPSGIVATHSHGSDGGSGGGAKVQNAGGDGEGPGIGISHLHGGGDGEG